MKKYVIYRNGIIYAIKTVNNNDVAHNENGPAIIYYTNIYVTVMHYNNNVLTKDNYPAQYAYLNFKLWYVKYVKDCKSHNENGPSTIEFHENGKISCEEYAVNDAFIKNGPCIRYFDLDGWVKREQFNNDDVLKPHIIHYNSHGSICQIDYNCHYKIRNKVIYNNNVCYSVIIKNGKRKVINYSLYIDDSIIEFKTLKGLLKKLKLLSIE